ncbi:MAG TPA: hypothetical protein VF712_13950 [Thermoleophilaceae bacterium]|jgi:NTP pyrophosphatase (non-canonical NTP hydrolase)
MKLDDYQRESAATDLGGDSDDPIVPLLGLAGEVGSLLAEFKKKQRPDGHAYTGFEDVVATELGDILWYLAALARRVGVPLSRAAETNLLKTRARWLSEAGAPPVEFDEGFPNDQRLPRQFEVAFSSYENEDGRTKVRMHISGEEIGDPIDDNARYPDHYRFHDVFHIAHAAVLGWSPIFRSLIGRKRKVDETTDRVEDGARAAATEEAVAALVFELSKPYDYFAGSERVDDSILNTVAVVTARLEVSARSTGDWERAILSGFAAWRGLREAGGGTIAVDLDRGTLELVG